MGGSIDCIITDVREASLTSAFARPANCRAFIYTVEEMPRQGRLEGCHAMSAALLQEKFELFFENCLR